MRPARLLRTAIAALALTATAAWAQSPAGGTAQSYPNQLVRIIVPFSAGSQTDILARAYAEKLQARWKQDVIVENRPGLAGTASVARAPNDGYTLLLVSNGHALINALNTSLTFDPIKDFAGVSRLAIIPGVMVVPPENGPKTLKELIDQAKARPGQINYASAGVGSASSIGAELLKLAAGIEMQHVPYRGLPEANTSVMRGDTMLFVTFFSAGGELIRAGKLHPVAVTTAKRMAVLPDVPTAQEAGVADYTYDPWFGLLAPAGTPKEILEKISRDVVAVTAAPDLNQKFTEFGVELAPTTPDEFYAIVKADTDKFTKIFARKN
jgi:tripartite-type tricarboxylate transporter receptor subunit TctC